MQDRSDQHDGGERRPLVLTEVLGRLTDQRWHDQAHLAEAAGQLETVRISRGDAARRRMRLMTDRGRDVALALSREVDLGDGSVVHAGADLMIIVRVDGGPRLRLEPADAASALRLGYFCGNLHWKVDFDGSVIDVHLDGPEEFFRARLADAADLCTFSVERLEAEE